MLYIYNLVYKVIALQNLKLVSLGTFVYKPGKSLMM